MGVGDQGGGGLGAALGVAGQDQGGLHAHPLGVAGDGGQTFRRRHGGVGEVWTVGGAACGAHQLQQGRVDAGGQAFQRTDLETLDQNRGVGAGQAFAMQGGEEGRLHVQTKSGEVGGVFEFRCDPDGSARSDRLFASDINDVGEGQDALVSEGDVGGTQGGQAFSGVEGAE